LAPFFQIKAYQEQFCQISPNFPEFSQTLPKKLKKSTSIIEKTFACVFGHHLFEIKASFVSNQLFQIWSSFVSNQSSNVIEASNPKRTKCDSIAKAAHVSDMGSFAG